MKVHKIAEQVYKWKRYLLFGMQYYFYEKPRGLDFTMKDQSELGLMADGFNGYSKTNEKHVKEIFELLPIESGLSLLDIGCGKGVVLKEAAKYSFQDVAGIDISDKLIQIARCNFLILRLEEKVKCETADALKYSEYERFNVFFLFNPFDELTLRAVIEKIMQDTKIRQKRVYVIYHNPVHAGVMTEGNKFSLEHTLFDELKQYETHIYISHNRQQAAAE